MVHPSKCIPFARNPRINDLAVDPVALSIREDGFNQVVLVDQNWRICVGHTRVKAALKENLEEIPVYQKHMTEVEFQRYNIRDNKLGELAQWNELGLKELLAELKEEKVDLISLGFDQEELKEIFGPGQKKWGGDSEAPKMTEQFGVPPFSVFDSRQGYWRGRKDAWLALGIKSEEGREKNLLKHNLTLGRSPGDAWKAEGTSIFDPVLCEIAYSWFCPDKGNVLDPFCGGSVRGIVASHLGRNYNGLDIRTEQIVANEAQAHGMKTAKPNWQVGDAREVAKIFKGQKFDFLFSCPPYADLEVYSKDPRDLSTMPYDEFLQSYRKVVKDSCSLLKEDSFAVFVVGEVRDKKGNYYNFIGDTVSAFLDAGLTYYNEIIYISALGSLPYRAGGMIRASRKIGKTHQQFLVFLKGDFKKAVEKLGNINILEMETE